MTRPLPTLRRLDTDAGFSLIEMTFAIGILIVTLVGAMSAISTSTAITENEGHLAARAAEYAQDKMEQLLALAYSDAVSDTTQIPTIASGGIGLAVGGSATPSTPVAKYVDYLKADGTPLCPCAGTTAPAGWFYARVWQVTLPTTNLKQITVTATVAHSIAQKIVPTATVSALKTRVGNE